VLDPDPAFHTNPDPGFWWPKIEEKNIKKNLFLFLWSKIAIYLSLGLHKRRPSYGEAFSPQKRTSSTSKNESYELF
jgi:hypothetical protein